MQQRASRTCWILIALLTSCLACQTRADHHAPKEKTNAAADVDVYLLSGQSNMVGSAQANQLADLWQQPIEGAYLYRGMAYETLVAGKDGKSGRFGPEVGFGNYMRNNQPGRPEIYLIKFALSGQPLDAGWTKANAKGGGWVGPEPGPNRTTFYPGESADDPNVGLHYKRLMAHTQAAIAALKAQGKNPVLRGVLWMQGEADAKHEVSAGRYDESLKRLKHRIEEDLGVAPVPFVFGQVLPHEPALERFTSRELLRKRMAQADWRSGDKRAVDGVWMVSTDGMDLLKDTVHYSTKGQLALGQAMGLEMLKAHRKAEQNKKK